VNTEQYKTYNLPKILAKSKSTHLKKTIYSHPEVGNRWGTKHSLSSPIQKVGVACLPVLLFELNGTRGI